MSWEALSSCRASCHRGFYTPVFPVSTQQDKGFVLEYFMYDAAQLVHIEGQGIEPLDSLLPISRSLTSRGRGDLGSILERLD
jgi:hypothetical protein